MYVYVYILYLYEGTLRNTFLISKTPMVPARSPFMLELALAKVIPACSA